MPGSGKTSFFQDRYAATHEHISKDLFPRHARQRDARQAALLTAALEAGRPVVIDNTNVSREERAGPIAGARAFGARIIGYYFDTPIRTCVARNARRDGRARVPNVAIFAAAKRLVMPARDEGFDELYLVTPHGAGVAVEPMAGGEEVS